MTSDRIRWCMKCNLMVSSRKCPVCRNDVLNIRLDKGSRPSPVFQNQADRIRSAVDSSYGDGCGRMLIPDDRTALFLSAQNMRHLMINGGIVGRLYDSGVFSLNASGLGIISSVMTRNRLTCDHDSAYFIAKGRNLMVTGVTDCPPGLSAGDRVAVFDEKGRPVAEGVMKMSSEEIGEADKGVAVSIRDCAAPRINDGRRHKNWIQTLDENSRSMKSSIGETVKQISSFVSSYGCPVVVELSSDILTEANLLLVLEAGIRPSVKLAQKDDFLDYLVNKHGLQTVDDLPERCIFITERKDISDADIMAQSPTQDWDPMMVWMYVMMRAEPFHPEYMKG